MTEHGNTRALFVPGFNDHIPAMTQPLQRAARELHSFGITAQIHKTRWAYARSADEVMQPLGSAIKKTAEVNKGPIIIYGSDQGAAPAAWQQ